jgi:pimeloyl-ACP methyl ester carboxylesterase
MISVTLALRNRELVERLILLCPTISGRLSLFINLFSSPVVVLESVPLLGWLGGILDPYVVGITDRIMRPASLSDRSDVSSEDYIRLREDARRPEQGRIRAECFWAMRSGDLRGKIKGLDVPSLVIWGMEDNTVPLRDASALADEWPDADLRILPRVSHWPQFEAPEVTRRSIKAFLGTPLNLIQAVF